MTLEKAAGGAAFGSSLYPYWVGFGYCHGWPDPAKTIDSPVQKSHQITASYRSYYNDLSGNAAFRGPAVETATEIANRIVVCITLCVI